MRCHRARSLDEVANDRDLREVTYNLAMLEVFGPVCEALRRKLLGVDWAGLDVSKCEIFESENGSGEGRAGGG